MTNTANSPTVMLFGTAGTYSDPDRSLWREPFKEQLEARGLSYFDPVVEEWDEAAAENERQAFLTAKHFICYIDTTTTSIGALAEIGFVLSKVLRNKNMTVHIAIKMYPHEEQYKDLNRARQLVLQRMDEFILEHKVNDQVMWYPVLSMMVGFAVNMIDALEKE